MTSGLGELRVDTTRIRRFEVNTTVALTHTFGDSVPVNLSLGYVLAALNGPPSHALVFGGARLGFRSLPLIQFHLLPFMDVVADAAISVQVSGPVTSAQAFLAGVAFSW